MPIRLQSVLLHIENVSLQKKTDSSLVQAYIVSKKFDPGTRFASQFVQNLRVSYACKTLSIRAVQR